MLILLVVSIFSYYHCSLQSCWWSWLSMQFVSVVMVSTQNTVWGKKIEFKVGKGCNCIFPYPLIQSKVLLSTSMRNRWIPSSLEVGMQTAALERK